MARLCIVSEITQRDSISGTKITPLFVCHFNRTTTATALYITRRTYSPTCSSTYTRLLSKNKQRHSSRYHTGSPMFTYPTAASPKIATSTCHSKETMKEPHLTLMAAYTCYSNSITAIQLHLLQDVLDRQLHRHRHQVAILLQ